MPSLQPADPSFIDTAPFRVVCDRTVATSVGACWSLIADQTSRVQWFDDMSSVSATPPVWTEPGQTRTVKVNGLTVNERAISIVPEREYAFTIEKWPIFGMRKAAEAIRLEDVSNGATASTRLTYIGAFDPNRIGSLLKGPLNKQLSTAWADAFEALGRQASDQQAQ